LENGRGTADSKKDPSGLKWILDAANANLPAAMHSIGERYRQGGGGVEKDPVAGMAWLEKGYKAGNAASAQTFANMLVSGEAGFQNVQTAANIYVELVKKGDPISAFQLGAILEAGSKDVPKDLVKAYGFYSVAEAYMGRDEKIGPTVKERVAKVKDLMSPEELKNGEALLTQLMGGPRPEAKSDAPGKDKPKDTKPAKK
jgi:TPR repeat protein